MYLFVVCCRFNFRCSARAHCLAVDRIIRKFGTGHRVNCDSSSNIVTSTPTQPLWRQKLLLVAGFSHRGCSAECNQSFCTLLQPLLKMAFEKQQINLLVYIHKSMPIMSLRDASASKNRHQFWQEKEKSMCSGLYFWLPLGITCHSLVALQSLTSSQTDGSLTRRLLFIFIIILGTIILVSASPSTWILGAKPDSEYEHWGEI